MKTLLLPSLAAAVILFRVPAAAAPLDGVGHLHAVEAYAVSVFNDTFDGTDSFRYAAVMSSGPNGVRLAECVLPRLGVIDAPVTAADMARGITERHLVTFESASMRTWDGKWATWHDAPSACPVVIEMMNGRWTAHALAPMSGAPVPAIQFVQDKARLALLEQSAGVSRK